ncbi:MAG: M23 family metallopeptidase [Clostridiales bacterium]|nr:M23 family metallopeptidase [Clostridiales bacterium]
MEKTLSVDERIRRAEEIYYRRKMQNSRRESATVNVNNKDKPNLKLFHRMGIQIIVCMLIYTGFYFIKNADYIFSDEIISKTKQILEYDINIQKLQQQFTGYINGIINKQNNEEVIVPLLEYENVLEQENNIKENIVQENVIEENIVKNEIITEDVIVEEKELTQEEKDVKEILSKYSLINPLQVGVVTSEFGERESTNSIVTPEHTGIDLGATEGTPIIASMEGTVETVSTIGDYGKHLKILNGNVITLYAHCSEILVTEGEKISQGQEIAKVGSTGNSTGPHLHFEIRKEGRYINPRLIVSF